MGEEEKSTLKLNSHVLLLPYPAQGHINPVLQFGKRLASKGLKITFATTVYLSKSMHFTKSCNFGVELISDGFDETGPYGAAASGENFLSTFKKVGSRTLTNVINKYNHGCPDHVPITCLVCDSVLPWALDVGKQLGLVTASFYTQSCSVSSIFYHITQGELTAPVEDPTTTVSLPGLPQLAFQDLPSSVALRELHSALEVLSSQFSNTDKADWLFFNTFDKLENQILKLLGKVGRVRAIGPAAPSAYQDKRTRGDTEHSLNLYKPSDVNYINWLNTKEAGSVLYISFGSMAELGLGKKEMEELALGIKRSDKDFLWILREAEQAKLPDGFVAETLGKGLVVPWCSQLEVLAHEAIGCFLTHCGWNSTMEALILGVPMIAMPYIWDQFTNAKFVEDVWGLGIRVKQDDKGAVRSEELESCIRVVMDGEMREAFKANATRWMQSAREAVDAGGSSDLNIEEFVASINC